MKNRLAYVFLGIVFAWGAIYITFYYIYQNLLGVTLAATKGGSYLPNFLEGFYAIAVFVCIIISTIFLTIGLGVEK